METTNTFPYVIVRTVSAGVFAGEITKKEMTASGTFCVALQNSRRLWKWEGAASLSQLAQSGTTKPEKCLFPEEVLFEELPQVIEILYVSVKARESIKKVPIWKI